MARLLSALPLLLERLRWLLLRSLLEFDDLSGEIERCRFLDFVLSLSSSFSFVLIFRSFLILDLSFSLSFPLDFSSLSFLLI